MSDPYIGEIRLFGGNYAPLGWAFCNGQVLPIAQYEPLYALIGTTYGGDGIQTFALPDLRGRLPIDQGSGYALGQAGGAEVVTLTNAQMPLHNHAWLASATDAEGSDPRGALLGQGSGFDVYGAANVDKGVNMAASTVAPAGGSQPHDNLQPYLCVSFIIALEGIFPQQG
jgi:microcystin-dependent protein